MYRDTETLQANLRKSKPVQNALHNDDELGEFTAILAQEPYLVSIDGKVFTPGVGGRWTTYLPTTRAENYLERGVAVYRSCLWVAADVRAIQITVDSSDITAVKMVRQGRSIVIISVYIPPSGQGPLDLQQRLDLIEGVMARQIVMDPGVEFIVGGDFNRHDSHWGGDWVADTQRQGEGEAIVDLMIRRGLQSLLPRGTVTWERDNGDAATTIDLSLASGRLADERVGCAIWPSDYGSDHRHIHTTYSLQSPEIQRLPRLLFKEAEWDGVRRSLQEAKHREPCPGGLDDAAAWLQSKVTEAVEEHCPRARPSPYVKRWWTPGLTYMRKEFTSLRNRARRLKYQGRDTGVVDREAATAKHRFAKEIEKQKKDHWNQFLDEPTNIWKVARYLDGDGQATFSPIQRITKLSSLAHAGEQGQDHNRYVTDNEGIAAELLASFFPPTAEPSIGEAREYHTQLPHEPLQKHEVERALWAANQDKAPGPDGLPMRVWREVWPVLQDELTAV